MIHLSDLQSKPPDGAQPPRYECRECHKEYPVVWGQLAKAWQVEALVDGVEVGWALSLACPPCRSIVAERRFKDEQRSRAAVLMEQAKERIPGRFRTAVVTDLAKTYQVPVKRWLDGKGDWCLYLYGPVGTGKTHAAYATALKRYHASLKPNYLPPVPLYAYVADLAEEMQIDAGAKEERLRVTKKYADHPGVVLLDDIGVEKTTPHVVSQLDRIIDSRYANSLPTIITSNLSPQELSTALSGRIADRVNRAGTIIEMSQRYDGEKK